MRPTHTLFLLADPDATISTQGGYASKWALPVRCTHIHLPYAQRVNSQGLFF